VSEPILLQGNSDPISAESKLYGEDDLVMISALQHLLFCPRQCALIHIEQQWAENRFTAEGRILHEKSILPGLNHGVGSEQFSGCRYVRFDMASPAEPMPWNSI